MGSQSSTPDYNYALSLDGKWILTVQQPGKLLVQHSDTRSQAGILTLGSASPNRRLVLIAKSVDRNWLILGYDNNTFTHWPLSRREARYDDPFSLPALFGNLSQKKWQSDCFLGTSTNGHWALKETHDRFFQLQDLTTGEVVRVLPPREPRFSFKYAVAATVANSGKFVILPIYTDLEVGEYLLKWDVKTNEVRPFLYAYRTDLVNMTTLAITSDERFCFIGLQNGEIGIYELGIDRKLGTLASHPSAISCIAISRDGKEAISGSQDGTLKIWDVPSKKKVISSTLDVGISTCLFRSDNEKVILAATHQAVHTFTTENTAASKANPPTPPEERRISHRIWLGGIPGENLEIPCRIGGVGECQMELYDRGCLIEQREFIREPSCCSLYKIIIHLPKKPWGEDLKGYVLVRSLDSNFWYGFEFTVNCLIRHPKQLNLYRKLTEFNCSEDPDRKEKSLFRLFYLQVDLWGLFDWRLEETFNQLISFYQNDNESNGEIIRHMQGLKQRVQKANNPQEVLITQEPWDSFMENEATKDVGIEDVDHINLNYQQVPCYIKLLYRPEEKEIWAEEKIVYAILINKGPYALNFGSCIEVSFFESREEAYRYCNQLFSKNHATPTSTVVEPFRMKDMIKYCHDNGYGLRYIREGAFVNSIRLLEENFVIMRDIGTDHESIYTISVGEYNEFPVFENRKEAESYLSKLKKVSPLFDDFSVSVVHGEDIMNYCRDAECELLYIESGTFMNPPQTMAPPLNNQSV